MTYDDKPWLSSYDQGVPEIVEIPERTFTDLLMEGLRHAPERPAMFYMGKVITFRELDDLSARFAKYLSSMGMGPGDVVAINTPNVPQYLITLAGAHRAGCATTGVSILLTPKELSYQLNDSGAKVLVTLDMFFEKNFMPIRFQVENLQTVLTTSVADYLPLPKKVLGKLFKKIPSGKVEPVKGKKVEDFLTTISQQQPSPPSTSLKPEDPCLIQYTGGTTGLPKGVVLTHRNIVANITQGRTWAEFKVGEDIFCSGFPFFHQAGQVFGMVAMHTANPQCLIPDPRNTTHICNEIKTRKATFIANVPTLYHMLMENPLFKALDFSRVRAFASGAAPFSMEGIKAMEKIVGEGKVIEVYGMTETSPLLTMNPYLGKKKVGSVGLPLPSTRVKIMDVDNKDQEVPIGKEGEIVANGPQVMARYHNKPEETNHAVREIDNELWLYTGDIGRMDEDGFLFIVDRAKDMLNVGGYKVFSREVEESLYKHPAIEFCAIVGVPHPDRPGSELVKAVIQLAKDYADKDKQGLEKEIRDYCKENMAAYKIPKFIEWTDAIPLTAVGKVDKKQLR